MKRATIIVFGALAAIWLLIMPMLLGAYLRGRVPEWTAGWPEPEAVQWHPGWFQSHLTWQSSDGISLALRARHAPILKPGLVQIEGVISSPVSPDPAHISAHVSLAGGWHLTARISQIEDPGSLALIASDIALNLARPARQPLTLILTAGQLGSANSPAAVPLAPVRLMARQQQDPDGRQQLEMELKLRLLALGEARLRLVAGPADPATLGEWFEAVVQWAASEPNSLGQRLALLGLAAASQQLMADGLVVRVEQLALGETTRIAARWPDHGSLPGIEGSGQTTDIIAWYSALAVLFGGQSQAQAERTLQAMLLGLAQSGWVVVDGDAFALTPPVPADPAD